VRARHEPIWGIFTVGFIGHIKRDRGWSRITLVGRFVRSAGFVTLRHNLFVVAKIVVITPISYR